MKNIVFDCERMKYENTGIFHYCLNLFQSLQNLSHSNTEKFILYCPLPVKKLFPNHEKITQSSLHKFLMPGTKDYSIWHATYQNTQYLPIRNKKIKVVLTIHDLNFMYDETKSVFKKEKHLRHLQNNINRSDAIICISDFCRSDVLHFCDTKNKPVHVIHNGTNALSHATLSPVSIKPLKKFIFAIGVLTKKKNFHTLLPLLLNNDLELVIAGKFDDQPYLNYLIDSAKELGVVQHLHLPGMITESEKSWYFENCYAFASPSLAEGFCMPVTEAMSVGKPLFLSAKTALPEIGGKVAFYFHDFESRSMQNVFLKGMDQYRDTDLKHSIMERGSTFSWDKAASKYMEVYHSLI